MGALSGLEILTPAGASVAALLLFRVTGLVWVAPLFSARFISPTIKTGFTILLVLLLWPAAMATGEGASVSVSTVLNEALIGITLGLGAGIFVGAAEASGDMLAVQMGLSGANVVDPTSQTQLPVLGQFLGFFVTALILSVGGHLVVLEAFGASLRVLPMGAPIDVAGGITEVVRLGSTLLWLGLRFAGPVIAAMVLANVAMGVLARTVPQLNVLMVAFPVQIGIGLFVLAATLPVIATAFAGWGGEYREMAGTLLNGLAPVDGGSP